MKQSTYKDGVNETPLDSWRDFIKYIDEKHSDSPGLLYRGQAHADWPVRSTLDRLMRKYPTTTVRGWDGKTHTSKCPPVTAEMQLEGIRNAARGLRGISLGDLDRKKLWILGQQHGLATPMLDWTWSPFVALYFAFEEKECRDMSGQWVEPPARAVWVFTQTNWIVEKLGLEVIVPQGEVGYRFASQGSMFLRMPQDSDLETIVRKNFPDDPQKIDPRPANAKTKLERIVIPNGDRIGCLKFLNKMNINRMSLFPDLDGAADFINRLWELNADWPLVQTPKVQDGLLT
ncbi:MAG: FRG domain-containing protein [Planctomycetota bacterium]